MAYNNLKTIGFCAILSGLTLSAQAQQPTDSLTVQSDSLTVEADSITQSQQNPDEEQPRKKRSFMKKFLDYFNDANKVKKNKKFDFSIIGGPHYSTDTKLGLGLVAAGLYKTDRSDPNLRYSNVSLFGDVSTVGFYLLGIRGNHIFPHDKYRMDYTIYFFSFPSCIWGIGYDQGNNDANLSPMERWQMQVKSNFLFRITESLYVGPMFSIDYVKAKKVDLEKISYQDPKIVNYGLGFALVADTRDVMTNPHKGYYINFTQCFRPKFLGNDYAFSTTDLKMSTYKRIWKGGILAGEFRGQFNWGDPSWAMMSMLGSSFSMRGYFEGRYRDKHKMEGQIELRQHIWKRNGLTFWLGAGTVFNKFSNLKFSHVLPNYGIGYRWEFKKDVNVRLDYGFGKNGQKGFIFNINEAF